MIDVDASVSEKMEWLSEPWRLEFGRQATAEAFEAVIEFVRVKLAYLFGAWCDESAEELVHDALADTYTGLVRWHPERVGLVKHLTDRVWHVLLRKRRGAPRSIRLDWIAEHDPAAPAVERALSYDAKVGERMDEHSRERSLVAWAWCAARAAQDDLAVAYLEARLAGLDGVADIAAAMGCAPAEVKAARQRLARLRRKAPPEVRALVAQWAA